MNEPALYAAIADATPAERDALRSLCLGRLLRLGSRPYRPSDDKDYAELRAIFFACADAEAA